MVELQDQRDRVFILSLFTFHADGLVSPEAILKHQNDIRVYIGIPYKQPEFYIKMSGQEESQKQPISIKKCMIGLIDHAKDKIEE